MTMITVEKELIGVCLNTPYASLEAMGVLPEYFSDPIYAAIWKNIRDAKGQYSVATIMSSVSGMSGASEKAYDAFDQTVADFATTKATASAVIDDYKRREGKIIAEWMYNAIERGDRVSVVAREYQVRIDALAFIGEAQSRFQPVAISDIEVPVTPWIVKGVMPASGVGFIAGAPGAGKSFLTLHTALSLASGRSGVLGRRCATVGVAYVAAEDFDGCKARVKAWELRHPSETPAAFEMVNGPINLLDAACVTDLVQALNGTARRFAESGIRLGLVVIDTLARCLPGADENNAQDMSVAVGALEDIGRRTETFVTAVAHHGKSGTAGGIRGWSGMNGASDMTLTVERDENDPSLRLVTLSKVKNGTDGAQLAFRLDRVGLGIFDEDRDEIDSCVCVFEPMPDRMQRTDRPLAPHIKIVFDAINFVVDNSPTVAPPHGAFQRVWSRAVTFEAVKRRACSTGFSGIGAEGHTRFSRALETLIAGKRIAMDMEQDLIWRI